MNFANRLMILYGAIVVSSCTATIEGQSLRSSPEQATEIQAKCNDLKKIGNVAVLSTQVDQEMSEIEDLLAKKDPRSTQPEIHKRAEKIKEYSVQLIKILGSEYSNLAQTQFVRWTVDEADFPLPYGSGSSLKPVSAKIDKVVIWNGEDSYLPSQFDIQIKRKSVRVQLVRSASLIELCQLEKLMNAVLSITFEDEWGDREIYQYRLKMKAKE